jgi:hypothetical protein
MSCRDHRNKSQFQGHYLTALMSIENNKVIWKSDPIRFLESKLPDLVSMYVSLIKTMGYNPQNVGKDNSSYRIIEMSINMSLMTAK